jgi:hypothetical protein
VRDTSYRDFLYVSFLFSFACIGTFGVVVDAARATLCSSGGRVEFEVPTKVRRLARRLNSRFPTVLREKMSTTATASIPVPVEQSPATLDKIKGNIANEIARVPLSAKQRCA